MAREGYKLTELGEIPEEWEVKKVRDIFKEINKRKDKNNEYKILSVTRDGIVSQEEYFNRRIASKDDNKYKVVEFGNLVVSGLNVHLGAIDILTNFEVGIVSPAYFIFNKNINMGDLQFYKYIIRSDKYIKLYEAVSQLGASVVRRNFSKEDFLNLLLVYPPLHEQQRIVKILSSNDEIISKLDEQIEKIKEVKQGLMQEFLTRGIGHTEFNRSELGEIPVEWEVKKLGETAYIKARIGWKGLSSKEYTSDGPYLVAGQHIKGSKIVWNICDHISLERYEESKEIQLQNDDIIISKDGTIGRLGYVENMPEHATINGTMMLIRGSECFYPKFLYFYFQGGYFQNLIKEKTSGSSIPHIFQRDMVTLFVVCPPLEEQQQIASILSNVDEKIEILEKKKQKYEEIKKGLIQDLLTGRVRVN